MRTNEKDMTAGSPGKLIITFAIPMMLGNIFQQFYTMADTMIVGQVVGVEALAAVGAGDWLVWLVLGIMTGITQGFSILVSQYYGAREKENLKCAVAKSYIMTALLSVVILAVFCASFSEAFHSFMRHHLPFRRGKCSRTCPSRSWRYT